MRFECMHVCTPLCAWCPLRPEEGMGSLGTGVTDSCELSAAAAGNGTQVLCSRLSSLVVIFYSFAL